MTIKEQLQSLHDGTAWLFCLGLLTLLGTCSADNSREVRELTDSIEQLERSINELRAALDALTATMEAMP